MTPIKNRFRGFLPVVVDVETGGFNAQTDALLEIAPNDSALIKTHLVNFYTNLYRIN